MTLTTHHAMIAARNWRRWGRHAAIAYAHNRGVPLRLVVLARQLQVAEDNGL